MLRTGPAVEEEPLELDQARVDDERLPVVERHPCFRESERVGDREPDRLEAMTPSRYVVKAVGALVAAAAFAPQLDLPLSELPDALVRDDAR